MSRTLVALTLGVLAAASGCTTMRVNEGDLLYPFRDRPLMAETAAADLPGYAFEEHTITAADGTPLYAVRLRDRSAADSAARLTVLYFGGNQYRVSQLGLRTARALAPLGVDVVLVDHRGYGRSEGAPTMALLKADALDTFDHVAALPGLAPERVVVHGQSLGSFFAGHVAARRPTAGVVLESSVTTTEAWGRTLVPALVRPFVRVRFGEGLRGEGNLPNVRRLDEPLLVLVGSEDNQTPPSLSEGLYREAILPEGRKRLAVLEGAGHNSVPEHPEFASVYRRFLSEARGAERVSAPPP